MADIVISGDSSGSVTLRAPAVSGTTVLTLPTVSGTIVTTAGATALTTSGNLTFTGTGNRILGDFSNGTLANRVAFQSSTTNGNTNITLIPNGTSVTSSVNLHANSDIDNASRGRLTVNSTGVQLFSDITGTGTYLPIIMQTGGSERLRIDTSGNVGIGTSSPAFASGSGLEVQRTGDATVRVERTDATNSAGEFIAASGIVRIGATSGSPFAFITDNTERMRITSAGRVGIGTTETGAELNVYGSNDNPVSSTTFWTPSHEGIVLRNTSNVTSTVTGISFQGGSSGAAISGIGNILENTTLGALAFFTGGSGRSNTVPERMRITSGGSLFVGTTAAVWNSSEKICAVSATANAPAITGYVTAGASTSIMVSWNNAASGTREHIAFADSAGGSVRGKITTDGANTTYGTSSDYRLKDNIALLTGALAKVQQLKPSSWVWKENGKNGEGFIAHELSEIIPQAVTGEKDAIDAEGKPVYQGIDTSFLVATLTAAIQEQQAIITDLKTRIELLEGTK